MASSPSPALRLRDSSLVGIVRKAIVQRRQHLISQLVAGAVKPRGGERQSIFPALALRAQGYEPHILGRHARSPARHDRGTEPSADQIDDRLLLFGQLGDPGPQSGFGKQLDRQVVTVRSRASVGHDERLIGKVLDRQEIALRKRV